MSARCPEGHLSEALDYCDVCGTPMDASGGAGMPPAPAPAGSGLDLGPSLPGPGAGGSAGAPAPSSPAPATITCPHCGATNVEEALFCEACGYDFTTGTPPMDSPAPEVDRTGPESSEPEDGRPPEGGAEAGEPEEPADEQEEAGDEHEAQVEVEPVEPVEPEPDPEPEPEPSPEHQPDPEPAQEAAPGPEAEVTPEPEPEPEPSPAEPAPRAHRAPRHTPPSRELADAWVVEVWVDPDWYAVQQTDETCPSAGIPDVVLLTRSNALVGRPSSSLAARPEIDAGGDSAVSRRHAQLSSDGQRWWIEDLGSSNGTFVGTVGEPLPTAPLTPGQRVEIDRDDRIFVGAWTRLALRHATDAEKQGRG
ncbi:FHA domain-containing protein [Ornithinimicrobium sp. CNJ-824]|uniref:FHA domain-containing protein n=1 Tax=Ornithinimicrobium sp. CNJ-824 TaxID=1904966 RepID=UPI000A56A640|nr:FHA domain-containing protein [Ornithinimicrobium sp. CNJ-824]